MSASNVEQPSSRPLFRWDVEAIAEIRGSREKAVWYRRHEGTKSLDEHVRGRLSGLLTAPNIHHADESIPL